METFENYLEIAKDIARRAGDFLMLNYGAFQVIKKKESTQYSIIEDKKCNDLYENFLRQKTPKISLYTEEGEKSLDNDFTWVIDPIDGTSNYRAGIPLFVTQICLLYKKEPIVSVLYNPALKQEFTAIKSRGAYMNGKKIEVNNVFDIKKSVLIQGKGRSIAEAAQIIEVLGDYVRTARIFGGCTGIDLAFIASGRGEIAINKGSEIYDYAPGVLLVREAGGLVKNFHGNDWTINDNNLIASNRQLMPQVLEIMKNILQN